MVVGDLARWLRDEEAADSNRPPRLTSGAWPMVALLARRANADQQRAGKPVSGACPAAEQQTERRIECLPSSFPGNRGDRAGHRGRRRQGSAISAVHRNRGVPCRISSALWGPGDGAAAPGNPSPGFDTSGHSAAPKCSNLGTRVDESNEYQAYRSRRSGDGCSRHACRWVRQRRDLCAHAFADTQCHVASG